MTVILVLLTFSIFLLIDWFTSKHPAVADDHEFDHTFDQFAELGTTLADGGKKQD